MDKSAIIVFVVLALVLWAWSAVDNYFLKKTKVSNVKERPAIQKTSPTTFMIVIIVLLLTFAIRQEIQMDDLKDQISSMESDLSSDIRDVKNAVYSTCN